MIQQAKELNGSIQIWCHFKIEYEIDLISEESMCNKLSTNSVLNYDDMAFEEDRW